MSTYVDKAISPKTGKPQLALFIDDHYGSHQYGVGFKDDGTDASLYDIENRDYEYTIYPFEEIKLEPDRQY
jgi:hypothetical protein